MSLKEIKNHQDLPKDLTLGQSVTYEEQYSNALLQAVPRSVGRDTLALGTSLPFKGVDIWNGYELSWLNTKGKPQVAILRCIIPHTSLNLVESKSFKLYLNSFNQSHFATWDDVKATLKSDLSACAGESVSVMLLSMNEIAGQPLGALDGTCIDEQDITVSTYQPDANLLITLDDVVEETVNSNLLKSNCLITNQPDWASIQVRYSGRKIDHASLLKYFISFRQHNEFHEQCVERIFCDILNTCKPDKLSVYARYTRRGGLDINPFRSNFEQAYEDIRLPRQ
ncbi:NADPH-dependent 7-cyano-7-deazaguanine reductase QueF [Alteromonas sediminis]|uniref:NADPH-dependent 7-cyano-7-deazaguanine reductase n=1 Tax=Alteromonas sediminis TaxID=2259342 RepID=A0A3N5Y533_9ALTE|nr:NADPH-dependent 7-cyano-7-deazaguanine reductase QueF [Alteromonas sediminis]RPJ68323.1 NADPH-dependent 7-cyano-7-deazaguanine reductase QueF [Alteromonas sediminis]